MFDDVECRECGEAIFRVLWLNEWHHVAQAFFDHDAQLPEEML